MSTLTEFRTFSADRLQLEDLVALAAFGSLLRQEYEKHQLEEPEFIDVQLKSLKREIYARNADKLEARRREIKSRLDSLKTPAQRKTELEKELKSIDAKIVAA